MRIDKYQPVIGLEIHLELKTQSKMFCQCPAFYFQKKSNSQTCPVCLGLPGALPVPNKKAIEWTILLGKVLNCQISKEFKFDRKHYFYPDLPKGYQISQYDKPIATNGYLKIFSKNEKKTFRIRRVHLEEDTGKLIHTENQTLIDFNRSGVPLIEIVTEPDFDNSDDVKKFLEEIQVIIRYLDISEADMEKGTMRLEPNISIKKIKNTKNNYNTRVDINELPRYKVEVKNINSFRFVKQAIDYEIKRQIELLKNDQTPIQETRGFDEKKQITYQQRKKEEASDYRYFPEPDIPTIYVQKKLLNKIYEKIPELPQEKLVRFIKEWQLRFDEAFILTRNNKIANYFELITIKLLEETKKSGLKVRNMGQLVANLIVNKKISTDLSPKKFIEKTLERLKPKKTDEAMINMVIDEIINLEKKAVDDYKKGKNNALMYLVGQAMKRLKGQVDPELVIEKIKKKLVI